MSNPISAVHEYLKDAWAELSKVTWPTRDAIIHYTLLVIGVSIAVGAFFAALDFWLNKGLDALVSFRNR